MKFTNIKTRQIWDNLWKAAYNRYPPAKNRRVNRSIAEVRGTVNGVSEIMFSEVLNAKP